MAKLAQTSVKYQIKASFTADGVVEKPDVIGALFGQTEGLLGPDLDLRELQRTGRIGRIEVALQFKEGKTQGEVVLPSSLDGTETALVAAALETIERVGPCNTKISVNSIEDLRSTKRRFMIDRAKQLLSGMLGALPETGEITEELMESVRAAEVVDFEGFPAGPDAATAQELTLVEGRADVMTLLRHGVKNVLGMGGTKIQTRIVELTKERATTVFLDGDRGGDLILKELVANGADIEFVARAPEGKEVEELTKKEVFKALRDKVPLNQAREVGGVSIRAKKREEVVEAARSPSGEVRDVRRMALDDETRGFFKAQLEELMGTRAAAIFDKNLKFCGRVPLRDAAAALRRVEAPAAVVADGAITRDLIRAAEVLGLRHLVGTSAEERSRVVTVLSAEEL